jgi:hypothetical protein
MDRLGRNTDTRVATQGFTAELEQNPLILRLFGGSHASWKTTNMSIILQVPTLRSNESGRRKWAQVRDKILPKAQKIEEFKVFKDLK